MPDKHARFSPSASNQLIHCPPSLRLCEECSSEDNGTDFTREGTEAHSVCEYLLKTALGQSCKDPRPALSSYNEEMQDCAEGYRDMILDLIGGLKDAAVFVEQQVSLDKYVPGCFGTSDCILISEPQMYVIDYKHGKGVEVSAEENPQLKCYALGAWLAFSPLYDIREITLVIYQPRISNYSRYTLSADSLLDWAEHVLKPAAALALKGGGEFSAGEWCRFCRAKAVCRKRAEENSAWHDFAKPDTLEDDEVNALLGKLDEMTEWAKDVKEYALKRALAGFVWADWKLVEGKSNRRYKDEQDVADAVTAAGFDPYKKELLGITEMTKLLGKTKFEKVLGSLIEKPKGKPTLVSRSDKRPEMNSAVNDFKGE